MIAQFTFYFRFLLSLLWLELLVGWFVSHDVKLMLVGTSTSAGITLMIVAVGVRFGFLRRRLAFLLQKGCHNPESTECQQLHDACARLGKANAHTADFIQRFETVWNLERNRRGAIWHGVISLLNSIAVSWLVVFAVAFAAREFHLRTPTGISITDKVALTALFVTAVIISGGHRRFNPSTFLIYCFIWMFILIGAVTCEGVVHYMVPLLFVNKLNLHRVHEVIVTAIAALLFLSHLFVPHQKSDIHKLLTLLHCAMLAGAFVLLWVEWGTHLGLEKGEVFFAGAIITQATIHTAMHVGEKFMPIPHQEPKALAQRGAL